MKETLSLHAALVRAVLLALLVGCSPAPPSPEIIEPWPLEVGEAVLSCEPAEIPDGVHGPARETLRRHGGGIYVTTADGRRYAVNGTARSTAPSVEAIQSQPDVRSLIARGLRLCAEHPAGDAVHIMAPNPPRAGEAVAPVPAARTTVEAGFGGGHYYSAESDELIRGQRARFTLSCEPGRAPMVMMSLIEQPRTAPPLRGVMATFSVGSEWFEQELSWGTEDDWTLRSGDARQADAQLARQIIAQGEVTLGSNSRYLPDREFHFDFSGLTTEEARTMRRECAP